MDLGITIKKLRQQRGKSQVDFSNQCGITQTYLSQIECNKKEPNLSTLKSISDQLGVPLSIIFFLSTTKDDVHPSKMDAFGIIEPSVKNFINEFFSL